MKRNILIFGCIICCLILASLSYQPIIAENSSNAIEKSINTLAIGFLHPSDKYIYFGWNAIYLGRFFPDMDFTIIVGRNIYNLFYGLVIRSDSNLSYIEIYANEELKRTLTEPTDYDGICQEWQVHWTPWGYNEIRVMAIDEHNNRFNAYQNLLVI